MTTARHRIQHNCVPPEMTIKDVSTILFVAERCGKSSVSIRYAIRLPQVSLLMQNYPLPIVDKPVGHLPSEISCRIIREVSLVG